MTAASQPKVSVILPVYNSRDFLHQAVRCILNQTFKDFELIILDDASTDDSLQIIREYAEKDERIVVLVNPENLGLTRSLNRGLSAAKGQYIARQDADDDSALDRLEKQVLFLEQNPSVGLLGSAYHRIDAHGIYIDTKKQPLDHTHICWKINFVNPFTHTSVMMRKKVLDQYLLSYNEDFYCSQDYDLWMRILNVSKGANLPEALVSWRLSDQSVGARHGNEQKKNWILISKKQICALSPEVVLSDKEIIKLQSWCDCFPEWLEPEDFPLCHKYLAIFHAFSGKTGYDLKVIRQLKQNLVKDMCVGAFKYFPWKNYKRVVLRLLARLFWMNPWFVGAYIYKIRHYLFSEIMLRIKANLRRVIPGAKQ